ncbi:MAG: GH116 family glycosyl-hydrolase [Lacrimispora sp.]|uniref:GH116 family glycosyl-hydrolase n=1 Tax=Lacrimispora sp. TaxID=2719234 RepID=UPI0039E4C5C4
MSIEEKRIWYDDDATAAKFLLGGIGTGNVSVGSRGQLCDWEIFNEPNVGNKLSYTFFAIRTQQGDEDAKVRVLESRVKPPYERSHGFDSFDNAGIPHFAKARLAGEVSQCIVELKDEKMPVDVNLTAFTPLIPLNSDDSSIPGAVLRYKVINRSPERVHVSLAGSISNPVGFKGHGLFGALDTEGEPENEYKEEKGMRGLYMTNPKLPKEHLKNGSMALVSTSEENTTVKANWVKSSWVNGPHDFWYEFEKQGVLEESRPEFDNVTNPSFGSAKLRTGSLCIDFELEAGESKEVEFILTWYFPNRPAQWSGHMFKDPETDKIVKNYYAAAFQDAWAVSDYLHDNMSRLEGETSLFREALYKTTLPAVMLDAMGANITVLRSTTCFRIEDGTFLGFEGSFDHRGCCEGNCSHVWNYQQTMAFLFPDLERNMRRTQFLKETCEDGEMAYRSNTVFGYPRFTKIPPAADGQMGTIIQLYRDWKLSGDDDFLREVWDQAVKALEYAFVKWDQDKDYVFDAQQHNTYDIEFYGKTSMTNSIFYAALKAGEEMAAYLGDEERAMSYGKARKEGSERMDLELWNGEFYIQKLENDGKYQYQYYDGCLSDQVLGQQLAHVAGLGYVLPKEHVKKAVNSVYKYNFRPDLSEHLNIQRVYALNDEAGLILCTWPGGDKPRFPFVYSDEVWSGIEYQVASHLIYENEFDKALSIVRAVRDRHDGIKRNPWNEVECGNHYVRSMASWGLLLASSGYQFDLTKGQVSFNPKVETEDYTCFFSTAKCWGLYSQNRNPDSGRLDRRIEILYGDGEGLELAPVLTAGEDGG